MARHTAEPGWLHTIGQIAGTLLTLELLAALFVILVIAVALAAAAWYLQNKVMPTVNEYTAKANQVMHTAEQSTTRVIQGVAEFHGRTRSIETIIRVLLFGRKGAENLPLVPVGTAQQGVRVVRGMSSIEGAAPQDLATNPNLSTRDIRGADLTPLTAATSTTTPMHARQSTRGPMREIRDVQDGPDWVIQPLEQNVHDGHEDHNGHDGRRAPLPPA